MHPVKLLRGVHYQIKVVHLNEIYVMCTFSWKAEIAQWYSAGLQAERLGVRVPAGAANFSLHHRIQTDSGAHPASCPMGTRGSFPGGKATRAWSWPLTSIYYRGQRMSEAIHPLPQNAFPAWCSVKAQEGVYEAVSKSFRTLRLERELQMV
jgi:hypothetical protein